MRTDDSISIPLQVVIVSDEGGGRRARVDARGLQQWVDFANRAFREAKIHFAFDPRADVDELPNKTINDMLGATDADWSTAKSLGNEIAKRHPGRLTVFVRHGPGPAATGAAFGGHDLDFVVMGGFEDMSHCGHPHVDALAHEIGHYLGLTHTFVGEPFPDVEAAAAHLQRHDGDPRAFDGDGIEDTPPDPAIRAFECERRTQVDLDGRTFLLPRSNLMSYYEERESLSPLQIERARWVLERRRRNAMRLPKNEPGPAAIEAEALEVVEEASCSTTLQPMDGFGVGDWCGGAQRFCSAEPGAVLTLALSVAEAGTYGVLLYATIAPDFGVIQCAVNGSDLGGATDLYAPVVLPTGAISLGRIRLSAGTHGFDFEVRGKHAASTGCNFGINAIELVV